MGAIPVRAISETVDLFPFVAGSANDAHGNPVPSFAASVEVGIWRFDPGGTSEPRLPGQDRVITEPTIYLPVAGIGANDHVSVRGKRYEVVGNPADWRNGDFAGLVVGLRLVEG